MARLCGYLCGIGPTARHGQTDPNFSNFLYDARTRVLHLIDFGAAREYRCASLRSRARSP
jgi:hypothetical protein